MNDKKFETLFDSFIRSNSSRQIKKTFEALLSELDIDGREVYLNGAELTGTKKRCTRLIYEIIGSRTDYWKSNELWKKYTKKASGKEYQASLSRPSGNPLRVLIIGSGPVGLRLSIECALLGFQCTVVEKRDRFSRNNVLHLWPYTIHDLKSLGAKLFYGKFCAGSIDHISIRKLQCVLLKVALLMGVQVHFNTSFEQLVEPRAGQGWRVKCIPERHAVGAEDFDVVIGADGRRNSLPGFRRTEFRGRLAIGITVNFTNYNTIEEQNVEERGGVAFIFDQKFFLDLKKETGIDLENIVYYKDDTHYFVMTAKRQSLLDKQVIKQDYSDATLLLSKENVNLDKLCAYAKEAAFCSTNKKLTRLDFAKNHYGQPDVAMFDFTSLFHAENASRIVVREGRALLMSLVGDSLLEPFWPLGTGIARGFLAAFDTAWQLKRLADGVSPMQLLYERESVYQLLSQTTHDNISKNYAEFSIDPATRYANLNSVKRAVQLSDEQLVQLYDDSSEPVYSPKAGEHSILVACHNGLVANNNNRAAPRRARIHNSSTTLLHWAQLVVQPFSLRIDNFHSAWNNGSVLLAIINRYKPDLL